MRKVLFGLLILLLFTATWTVGGVLAEEDALVYRGFDVSVLVRARPERSGGVLGMLATWEREPEPPRRPEAEPFLDRDHLVDLVRGLVDPESWDQVEGAFLDTTHDTLRVRHRPAVIQKVKALLDLLTKQAQARALVSVEVEEGQATVVGSVSLDLPFGVHRFAKATRRMQYVVDYEVEIAQASGIAVPVVWFPEDGLIVDARVTPLLDGRRVLVEAIVQHGRYDEALRRLTLGIDEECFNEPFRSDFRSRLGTLDLPSFDAAKVHWTAVVASGGTIEVPLAWNGMQHTIRLNVERTGGGVEGGPWFDLASLGPRPFPCRVDFPGGEDRVGDREAMTVPWLRCSERVNRALPLVTLEEWVDLVTRVVQPETWDGLDWRLLGPRFMISPEARGLRAPVRAFLLAQEAAALRPVVLDLRVFSVAGAVEAGPGRSIDGAEARLLAAGRVPTILGRMASILVGNTSNFLADYSAEVAQQARISDPFVGQAFDGFALNLLPQIPLDGKTVSVDLDLLLSIRTLDPDPPSLDAQFLGPLDRVQTRRSVVATEVLVPMGGTSLIDLGLDPRDPSRRLVAQLGVSTP